LLDRPIARAFVLAAACFAAIAPFFGWGSPTGHDFEFHVFSWMEVLSQWKHSIVYPRWAALAHWGYGEARFLFYPPASWTLGAALGALLPWRAVPGAYCWIALALAGAAMYRLARQWLPASDALFAAGFYALNPYHLLIVYWRSAYAELLAAALLPLVLLFLLQIGLLETGGPRTRPTLLLGLTLAASWLTNIPAAIMIHYSAAGLAAVMVFTRAATGAAHEGGPERLWGLRSGRVFLHTSLAILLGACIASFYLIPAIYERRWIDIGQVLSPGVRPQDNFLFTAATADPDHNRFNLLVSTVAMAELGVLAFALWFSLRRRAPGMRRSVLESSWTLLAAWGTASAFFMLSLSNLLWRYLPEFRFVQLPFRWLLSMNAALAVLVAMAARGWRSRSLVAAFLLVALLLAGRRFQPPWWVTANDIQEMNDAVADGGGYEGVDEYVPAGADPYELNKGLPLVGGASGVPVRSRILLWGPTEKHFVVHASEGQDLILRLFSYPAWEVVVNGKPIATEKTEVSSLMVVPVPAGDNDVHIYFRRTIDRVAGNVVSLIGVVLFLLVWFKAGWFNSRMVNFGMAQPGQTQPATRRSAAGKCGGPLMTARKVLVATSNPGKLRDFAGAASSFGIELGGIPHFSSLPEVVEDGSTFEENARKKAESYSLAAPGELVLADDSGLEIDALGGAPGVRSARYAAEELRAADRTAIDAANNAKVLRELKEVPGAKRTARFICVLAAARDGRTLATFRGTAEGAILDAPRGTNGFGYDPLFFFSQIGRTFAELSAEEKAQHSHRGAAFRAFLEWYEAHR